MVDMVEQELDKWAVENGFEKDSPTRWESARFSVVREKQMVWLDFANRPLSHSIGFHTSTVFVRDVHKYLKAN